MDKRILVYPNEKECHPIGNKNVKRKAIEKTKRTNELCVKRRGESITSTKGRPSGRRRRKSSKHKHEDKEINIGKRKKTTKKRAPIRW
jgi:hypothetical protein